MDGAIEAQVAGLDDAASEEHGNAMHDAHQACVTAYEQVFAAACERPAAE
ncbi:hypothetical protein AB0I28_05930 [Phytomonospora sp. NPDC050363]